MLLRKDRIMKLIVVEDGSTDNTRSIVNDFNFHDKRVKKLLSLPTHLGKGGSIASAAPVRLTKEFVTYMDVDLARATERKIAREHL